MTFEDVWKEYTGGQPQTAPGDDIGKSASIEDKLDTIGQIVMETNVHAQRAAAATARLNGEDNMIEQANANAQPPEAPQTSGEQPSDDTPMADSTTPAAAGGGDMTPLPPGDGDLDEKGIQGQEGVPEQTDNGDRPPEGEAQGPETPSAQDDDTWFMDKIQGFVDGMSPEDRQRFLSMIDLGGQVEETDEGDGGADKEKEEAPTEPEGKDREDDGGKAPGDETGAATVNEPSGADPDERENDKREKEHDKGMYDGSDVRKSAEPAPADTPPMPPAPPEPAPQGTATAEVPEAVQTAPNTSETVPPAPPAPAPAAPAPVPEPSPETLTLFKDPEPVKGGKSFVDVYNDLYKKKYGSQL